LKGVEIGQVKPSLISDSNVSSSSSTVQPPSTSNQPDSIMTETDPDESDMNLLKGFTRAPRPKINRDLEDDSLDGGNNTQSGGAASGRQSSSRRSVGRR